MAHHPQAVPKVALGAAGTLFFGSLCVGTGALGVWQTQRFFEKQRLVEQRTNDLVLDPVTYPHYVQQQQAASTASSFRRIRLTGRFQYDQEFLVGPRGPPAGALPDGPGTSAAGMASSPQGYFVLTPLELLEQPSSDRSDRSITKNNAPPAQHHPVVLVNRGWLPRQMVPHLQQQHQRGQQQQPRNTTDDDATAAVVEHTKQQQTLPQWNRPSGTVHVTVVPAKPEVPKFLVAQHNLAIRPAVLFWYDLPTMLAVAGIPVPDGDVDTKQQQQPLLLVTQVQADDETDSGTVPTSDEDETQQLAWPVQPTADRVGDFKVTPAVHAGYAATWYGLCAAGLYMTRILLTRGR